MTDDVKALAERAEEYLSSIGNKGDCGPHHLVSDMMHQLLTIASQREAVIDREAIARIIDEQCYVSGIGDSYQVSGIEQAADAIIRSLPSREVQASYKLLREFISFVGALKADDIPDSFLYELLAIETKARHVLAAQPRSNSVEDGAGRIGSERNPPQKAVIDTEQSGHVPSQAGK